MEKLKTQNYIYKVKKKNVWRTLDFMQLLFQPFFEIFYINKTIYRPTLIYNLVYF